MDKKEEYSQCILQMLETLNEKDLRQIFTIVHAKYIKRKSEQEVAYQK